MWIESGEAIYSIILGDTSEGKTLKDYLSFNIRELHGKTVQDAEMNFKEFAEYLDVKAVNHENTLDSIINYRPYLNIILFEITRR